VLKKDEQVQSTDKFEILKQLESQNSVTTEAEMPKKELEVPREELKLMTLIAQREKLSRDDLTVMMLAGEESLKMLIRKPSQALLEFVR